MIKSDIFAQKSFLVIGLGKTGLACVAALEGSGASNVITFDDSLDGADSLRKDIIQKINAKFFDFVVVSPGVPHPLPQKHSLLVAAENNRVEILTDLDLLYLARPNDKYITITGSNGKSTVTALIYHILEAAHSKKEITGTPVLSGNIGVPVMGLCLDENGDEDYIHVIEVSSFQSERIKHLKSDYAIFLNLQKDHLDRHGDMEGYFKSKKRLLDMADKRVICVDDEYGKRLASLYGDDSIIIVNSKEGGDEFKQFLGVSDHLFGDHNLQNIAVTVSLIRDLGVSDATIKTAIASFKTLSHRQEIVREIEVETTSSLLQKITFINDSKATNFDSTITALRAFDNIIWVAGGRLKEGALDDNSVIEKIQQGSGKIIKAFFIGEAAEGLSNVFSDINHEKCNNLSQAIEKITSQYVHGYGNDAFKEKDNKKEKLCVLFSPACASYDQYKNFEERGNHFKELVNSIK